MVQVSFESFVVVCSSVSDLSDRLLPFGYLLSYEALEILEFVFAGLYFGFLQRTHCLVLLQLLLIEGEVYLEFLALLQ